MYAVCAATEGNSPHSIAIVRSSVTYLGRFLAGRGASTDVRLITPMEIRAFIIHLRERRCYDGHPYTRAQERGLSGHTVNTYLRSIRVFFSWLRSEGAIERSPFDGLRIPAAPQRVIPAFTPSQIHRLLGAIDTATPQGYRDFVMVLTLLDTGLRISELTGLRLCHVSIEDGQVKVLGKGGKERVVPVGLQVAGHLWRYISWCRPEPAAPRMDLVFLTGDGRPLTRYRAEKRMAMQGPG